MTPVKRYSKKDDLFLLSCTNSLHFIKENVNKNQMKNHVILGIDVFGYKM